MRANQMPAGLSDEKREQSTQWVILLALLLPLRLFGESELHTWDDFSKTGSFQVSQNHGSEGGSTYLSPIVTNRQPWKELMVSWNLAGTEVLDSGRKKTAVAIEARGFHHGVPTVFYSMGHWTIKTNGLRSSSPPQRDENGAVATDTLILNRPADAFQIQITTERVTDTVKFVAVCTSDLQTKPEPLPHLPEITISVPEKSQANFPEGIEKWCSPTTTAMLMDYWATRCSRPEWRFGVRETAAAVWDPGWPGTGNWSFNMAFVGAQPGLRGCVARANRTSDLVPWISAGYPVGVSVSFSLLNGQARASTGDGHLIVVCGFTAAGKVIIADPGRALPRVHREIEAAAFVRAWAASSFTAYLVWPDETTPPSWGKTQ